VPKLVERKKQMDAVHMAQSLENCYFIGACLSYCAFLQPAFMQGVPPHDQLTHQTGRKKFSEWIATTAALNFTNQQTEHPARNSQLEYRVPRESR
jgi:hypothetical protein